MEPKLIKERQALDTQQQLTALLPHVIQAAKLDERETSSLQRSLAAEIIVATAYLSGCRNPERISVTHLCTLVAAARGAENVFNFKPCESLSERLEAVNHYPGGNPEVINAGMLLLELLSLNDHKLDIADDIIAGKQNPLIIEQNYTEEKERILKKYEILNRNVKNQFDKWKKKTINPQIWYG